MKLWKRSFLVRIAMDEGVVATWDEAPKTARHLAELFVDEDLLQ